MIWNNDWRIQGLQSDRPYILPNIKLTEDQLHYLEGDSQQREQVFVYDPQLPEWITANYFEELAQFYTVDALGDEAAELAFQRLSTHLLAEDWYRR